MSSKGKKGGKKKKDTWQKLDVTDVLAVAPHLTTVTSSWADEVEEYEKLASTENLIKKVAQLPSAPRAAVDYKIDDSLIPPSGPFIAYLSNLPYEITEDLLLQHFSGYKVAKVNLPKDDRQGRMKGFGFVEFEDKASLVKILEEGGFNILSRHVNVSFTNNIEPQNERGGSSFSRYGGESRQSNFPASGGADTDTDWRRGAPTVTAHDNDRGGYSQTGGGNRRQEYDHREQPEAGFESQNQNFPFSRGGGYREERSGGFRDRGGYGSNRTSVGFGGRDGGSGSRGFERRDGGGGSFYGNRDGGYGGRDNRGPFQQPRTFYRGDNRNADSGGLFARRGEASDRPEPVFSRDLMPEREVATEKEAAIPDERPKISLLPRTKKPDEVSDEPVTRSSSIFGKAKPVDTTKKILEIEAKLSATSISESPPLSRSSMRRSSPTRSVSRTGSVSSLSENYRSHDQADSYSHETDNTMARKSDHGSNYQEHHEPTSAVPSEPSAWKKPLYPAPPPQQNYGEQSERAATSGERMAWKTSATEYQPRASNECRERTSESSNEQTPASHSSQPTTQLSQSRPPMSSMTLSMPPGEFKPRPRPPSETEGPKAPNKSQDGINLEFRVDAAEFVPSAMQLPPRSAATYNLPTAPKGKLNQQQQAPSKQEYSSQKQYEVDERARNQGSSQNAEHRLPKGSVSNVGEQFKQMSVHGNDRSARKFEAAPPPPANVWKSRQEKSEQAAEIARKAEEEARRAEEEFKQKQREAEEAKAIAMKLAQEESSVSSPGESVGAMSSEYESPEKADESEEPPSQRGEVRPSKYQDARPEFQKPAPVAPPPIIPPQPPSEPLTYSKMVIKESPVIREQPPPLPPSAGQDENQFRPPDDHRYRSNRDGGNYNRGGSGGGRTGPPRDYGGNREGGGGNYREGGGYRDGGGGGGYRDRESSSRSNSRERRVIYGGRGGTGRGGGRGQYGGSRGNYAGRQQYHERPANWEGDNRYASNEDNREGGGYRSNRGGNSGGGGNYRNGRYRDDNRDGGNTYNAEGGGTGENDRNRRDNEYRSTRPYRGGPGSYDNQNRTGSDNQNRNNYEHQNRATYDNRNRSNYDNHNRNNYENARYNGQYNKDERRRGPPNDERRNSRYQDGEGKYTRNRQYNNYGGGSREHLAVDDGGQNKRYDGGQNQRYDGGQNQRYDSSRNDRDDEGESRRESSEEIKREDDGREENLRHEGSGGALEEAQHNGDNLLVENDIAKSTEDLAPLSATETQQTDADHHEESANEKVVKQPPPPDDGFQTSKKNKKSKKGKSATLENVNVASGASEVNAVATNDTKAKDEKEKPSTSTSVVASKAGKAKMANGEKEKVKKTKDANGIAVQPQPAKSKKEVIQITRSKNQDHCTNKYSVLNDVTD